MNARRLFTSIFLASSILGSASAAHASFLVQLDTSPLSGPLTIGFQLSNFNPGGNIVSLLAFDFGGGSPVIGSEDCTLGGTFSGAGCSGNLSSTVTLQDLDPTVFFTQQFNAGSTFSFVVTATNNFGGGTPDQFSMFLCDETMSACYSDDATGAMLLLDLNGTTLSPSSFSLFGSSDPALAAATVTEVADPTQVPEPSTWMLVAGALAVLASRRPRRRQEG